MLNMGILGLGQCGSNIAEYAVQRNFKAVVANTALVDLNLLKYVPIENRIHLGGKGAGRNRTIGKQAMVQSADKLLAISEDKFKDCDVVFVVASGSGGTGSGALPVALDIISDLVGVTCVINVLPDKLESPSSQINSLDCISEISQIQQIGSIFFLDNEKAKMLNPSRPKFKVQKISNANIIDILCEINKFTEKTSYTNNFDEVDFLDLLSLRGCSSLYKTVINEEIFKTNDVTANIQKGWVDSYNPNYNISDIVKCAVIANVNQDLADKISIKQIFNDNIPYDTKDSFYDINDNRMEIYSLFSGLQFPMERMEQMKQSIENIQDKLAEKIEKSQNQTIESFSWKINNNSLGFNNLNSGNDLKQINLAEKLSKYKG